MSSPTPPQTTNTKHPSPPEPQHKSTPTPTVTVSGKYRNANLPPPTYLHSTTVYVLSYSGRAWPAPYAQYDGILGAYTSLEHARRAGTRWLTERPGVHSASGRDDEVPETRFSEWKGDGAGGEWWRDGAVSGVGFLEARVVRVQRCEVRVDGLLPKEGKGGGGEGEEGEGGRDGGKEGEEERKDHGGDEQGDLEKRGEGGVVEEMGRLTVGE